MISVLIWVDHEQAAGETKALCKLQAGKRIVPDCAALEFHRGSREDSGWQDIGILAAIEQPLRDGGKRAVTVTISPPYHSEFLGIPCEKKDVRSSLVKMGAIIRLVFLADGGSRGSRLLLGGKGALESSGRRKDSAACGNAAPEHASCGGGSEGGHCELVRRHALAMRNGELRRDIWIEVRSIRSGVDLVNRTCGP